MMMVITMMATTTMLMMTLVNHDVDEDPLQLAYVGQVWDGSPLL